jgi:hypothetical protein
MRAAFVARPPIRTLDYSDRQDVSDIVLPLMRRAVPSSRDVVTPPPMIVDKRQLVRLVSALRSIPESRPTRIPRLSDLVRQYRSNELRRAQRRTWLARIAIVLAFEVMMVWLSAGHAPVGTFLHQCWASSVAWHAGAAR